MAEGASIRRIEDETHSIADTDASPAARDKVRELRKPAPEFESPVAPEPASDAGESGNAVTRELSPKRGWKRPLLFAVLPLALAAGAYAYITGGKVMSTDNAYIRADTVGISTDVAGIVTAVEVHDNQAVKKGQILYRLKPDSFQIALDGAKAQLATVHDQILTLQASYKLSLAQIDQAQADLSFYQTAFKRQQDLVAGGAGTKAAYDSAKHDLDAIMQKIQVAKAQADTALAQLGGDPKQKLENNPFYLQAKSSVDNAQRDLNDTVVRAPFDGIVTNVNAIQPGSYLQVSQQAFSLVSSTNVWVEASPKETELTYVRPGQSATVAVDTYPGVAWKGIVDSISPASGSSFSLLPAQNTTGNWVKVVQRIPMRVRIVDMDAKPPLRIGMSVTVDVDTGQARGLPEFVTNLLDRSPVAFDGIFPKADKKPNG